MDLKHSTDFATVATDTCISGSKLTDFMKPKDSSKNLEAQNHGKIFSFYRIIVFYLKVFRVGDISSRRVFLKDYLYWKYSV